MSPSFDTWTIIFLFASVQGVFLASLLALHKKGNRKANKILALLISLFSVTLLYYVMFWTKYATRYNWMNGWIEALPFLFGPCMWWYIKTLDDRSPWKSAGPHFIPFYINFIFMLPMIVRNTTGYDLFSADSFFFPGNKAGNIIFSSFITLQCISLCLYGVFGVIYIRNDAAKLSEYSIEAERIKHRWLKRIVIYYCIFAFASVSYWILAATRLIELQYDYAISATMAVFIYMCGYTGFRQPSIFNEAHIVQKDVKEEPQMQVKHLKQHIKYEKTILKPGQAEQYRIQLLQYMENVKPFLQNDLRIQDIAAGLHISTHHLSRVINELLNVNYADFINEYRVREACRILAAAGSEEKIISIAYDVGYNNKATFNTAFKKFTGLTPSEYKKACADPEFSQKIGSKLIG